MRKRSFLTITTAAALVLAGFGAGRMAAQMPADAVLRDFKPSGDFVFELEDQELAHAEIYLSETAVAYLILAPELESPVMISPRAQSVETVNLMKVAKRGDGMIDLLADAVLAPQGGYQLQGQSVVFHLGGKKAVLKPRPPLVGQHKGSTLLDYNVEYVQTANAYQPTESYLEALRAIGKDVRLRVYFGSWCPVCKRKVPKLLKLEEVLGDGPIHFEYYGLPHPMSDDPITERDKLAGVPTVIVYVDGHEVGRLTGAHLDSPEASLSRLLGDA